MKINRIRIKNFRSIEDSEVIFGDLTVLAGREGAGKSSHLHAICAAWTGRTPHTDRAGKGIKSQIRRDQPRAEIETECCFNGHDPASTIRRTITESSQTLEVPFGGKNLTARQALLTERLGGVDEVPDVLLDPRLFADRDEKEQTQALLKLLRPPLITVPPEACAVGIQSLASIQQVDDQIKSLKEGSIRALNAVIANLEETCPEDPSAEQMQAAHEAEDALARLDARMQSLALEIQNAQFLLDDARRHAEEVEQARELAATLPVLYARKIDLAADDAESRALIRRIYELKSELKSRHELATQISAQKEAESSLPGLREQLEAERTKLQEYGARYQELVKSCEEAAGKAGAISARIDALRETVERIESIEGQCPTCARKMTAKAKAEVLQLMTSQREAEILAWKAITEPSAAENAERLKVGEAGKAARQEVDRLAREVALAVRAAAALSAVTALRPDAEIENEINQVKSEIGALVIKHNPDEAGLESTLRRAGDHIASQITEAERAKALIESGTQADPGEFSRRLVELRCASDVAAASHPGALQAAQAARDTLRREEDFKRIVEQISLERAKRERYSMALESLVRLKDGILGGESARKLQSECTAIFEQYFPGAKVILDPSGASVAPSGASVGTPVGHLSSGQKVIFDMALRIAAARATGFHLLAIDDANKLAPRGREGMLKTLLESGCQVIMCITADSIGPIQGAKVYRISNPSVWGPTTVESVG